MAYGVVLDLTLGWRSDLTYWQWKLWDCRLTSISVSSHISPRHCWPVSWCQLHCRDLNLSLHTVLCLCHLLPYSVSCHCSRHEMKQLVHFLEGKRGQWSCQPFDPLLALQDKILQMPKIVLFCLDEPNTDLGDIIIFGCEKNTQEAKCMAIWVKISCQVNRFPGSEAPPIQSDGSQNAHIPIRIKFKIPKAIHLLDISVVHHYS